MGSAPLPLSVFPCICSVVPFQLFCQSRLVSIYPKGFCSRKQCIIWQCHFFFLHKSGIHDSSSEILLSSINLSHLSCSHWKFKKKKLFYCWFSDYESLGIIQKSSQKIFQKEILFPEAKWHTHGIQKICWLRGASKSMVNLSDSWQKPKQAPKTAWIMGNGFEKKFSSGFLLSTFTASSTQLCVCHWATPLP